MGKKYRKQKRSRVTPMDSGRDRPPGVLASVPIPEDPAAAANQAERDTAAADGSRLPDARWESMPVAQTRCQAFSESLGFPYYRFSLNLRRSPFVLERAELCNFPRVWVDRYRRYRYANIDPSVALLQHALAPFAWDETDRRDIEVSRYYEDAAFHGLIDGFTVPLHFSTGESASLTLAGAHLPAEPEARWSLYFATYRFQCAAFISLRALVLQQAAPSGSNTLTEKQRRILHLLMQGMGVKSIARVLKLHSRTVDDGLRRACLRLGVSCREQAIVRALATGQIDASTVTSQATDGADIPFAQLASKPVASR